MDGSPIWLCLFLLASGSIAAGRDIDGFQYELLVNHLGALESRIEQKLTMLLEGTKQTADDIKAVNERIASAAARKATTKSEAYDELAKLQQSSESLATNAASVLEAVETTLSSMEQAIKRMQSNSSAEVPKHSRKNEVRTADLFKAAMAQAVPEMEKKMSSSQQSVHHWESTMTHGAGGFHQTHRESVSRVWN